MRIITIKIVQMLRIVDVITSKIKCNDNLQNNVANTFCEINLEKIFLIQPDSTRYLASPSRATQVPGTCWPAVWRRLVTDSHFRRPTQRQAPRHLLQPVSTHAQTLAPSWARCQLQTHNGPNAGLICGRLLNELGHHVTACSAGLDKKTLHDASRAALDQEYPSHGRPGRREKKPFQTSPDDLCLELEAGREYGRAPPTTMSSRHFWRNYSREETAHEGLSCGQRCAREQQCRASKYGGWRLLVHSDQRRRHESCLEAR